MSLVEAIILAIVEGITEFLPISSTGHLVVASEVFHIPQTEFIKSFEIIIQLGAILAVVILYIRTLLTKQKIWLRILAAFLPTAFIGFVLYDVIKGLLIGNTMVTLWALFLGGIALIILEKFYQEKPHHYDDIANMSYKKAVLVGIFQSLSVIPGVSRAASTICGGLFVGMKRKTAVEFSFLLAVPTMAAATGLDLIKSSFHFTPYEWMLLAVGFTGAFITALITVKYFLRFIQHHTFVPFGVYRILLAIVFWFFVV